MENMKKIIYPCLILALFLAWSYAGADIIKKEGQAEQDVQTSENIESNINEQAVQFKAVSPFLLSEKAIEESSVEELNFREEIEPISQEELDYLRLMEIEADGVVSEDERDEYREIIMSVKAPEFPPVIDNIIYETEPNNTCDSANVMSVGDTVQCAWIDGMADSIDYYTFTLDSTYANYTVTVESHNGQNCGPGLNIFTLAWIYNSDCTVELAYADGGGWNGHAKIVTFLTPGTYVIKFMPDGYWLSGWYHLSLLAEEYIPIPGQDCDNALSINIPADLPYSDLSQVTCGKFNFYNEFGCQQDTWGYGGNEEIIYRIAVTEDGWYDFTLDPKDNDDAVMALGTECPPVNCVFFNGRYDYGLAETNQAYLEASVGIYYLMIDSRRYWYDCLDDFDLTITAGTAPIPGELCQNPIEIPTDSVAGYSDTRDTRIYQDNHKYGGKDVVYTFTLATTEILSFSLCNSPEDWKGYVWLYPEASTVCNGYPTFWQAPACLTGGLHTELLNQFCPPGTYYVIVDGSYTPPNEGWYTLDITAYVEPCSDVSEIPYNDSCQNIVPADLYMGNTLQFSGNNCNSTQDCDTLEFYLGLPGVWEAFTITDTGNVTIDFCGTSPGWGSVVTVLFEECPCTNGGMRYRAGNGLWWDACDSANVATMLWVQLPPGTYYYNVLQDTSWGAFGEYTINITLDPPYEVTCPPGGIDEGEPPCYDYYVDNYNSGCYFDPPNFQTIYSGDVICGTGGTYEPWPSMDRDVFEYEATDWVSIEWKAVAEYPLHILLTDGTRGCDNSVLLARDFNIPAMDTGFVAAYDLPPGKYWMQVMPWSFSGYYCPSDYTAFFNTTPGIAHYCEPCFTNNYDWIEQVIFNTINNYTGSEPGGCSYGDYTSLSTDVEQYGTYTLTVSVQSNPYWRYVRAWIDWNQNMIFEDEESYYLGDNVDPVVSIDIMVPGDALVGPTRMRIMEAWTDPDPDGACSSSDNGETEDYTINVLAGIPPIFSVSPTSIEDSVGLGEIATQVLTVSNLGTGADLAFESDVWIDPPGPSITNISGNIRKDASLIYEGYTREHVDVNAPLNPNIILQGGEDISTAEPITAAIPTTVSGTTYGYADDYYEVCPMTAAGGLDVVYSYTPTEHQWLSFNLCLGNTDFDTRMYIYEDSLTAGDPYACNDDACQSPAFPQGPWQSSINNVLMAVGHTYYIVIDGYNLTSNGNYTLDIFFGIEPPRPEECPDGESSVYNQDPSDETQAYNFFTADVEPGYICYDNYAGAYGEITGMTWWGLDLFYDGINWYECDVSQETFIITFFNDNYGMPGSIAYADTVVVSVDSTDYSFWGYQQKRYYTEFSEPIYHPEGWLSIQGGSYGDNCWFLWQNSFGGDENSLQYDYFDDEWYLYDSDFAFCFEGSPYNWFSIDVEGGLVPSGQTTDITVTMDATELTDNTYTGNVRFRTNEPTNPNPSVPVTFIVGTGVPPGCDYIVGDVNNSASYNGLDITFGVAFFKGGSVPICDYCPLCPDWNYCGDVNGSCTYNGLDITYGVAYFKGGATPLACDDCPPIISATSINEKEAEPNSREDIETKRINKTLTK